MSRSSWFPKTSADVLNSYVLYVALPAIILLNLPNLIIDSEVWIPVGFHWGLLIVHFLLLWILRFVFNWSKEIFSTLLVVTTMGNTAFLGIPLSEELFGADAIPYAVIYDQLGSGIAFILYSSFLIPFLQGRKGRSIKEVLKGLVTFPPFIALTLGFLLNGVEFIPEIRKVLEGLSATLVPCAIISVGYQLKLRLPREVIAQMSVGLFVKLLGLPLIALGIIKAFNLSGVSVDASLLQSGMPPMITGGVLAIVNKMDEKLTVGLVGYGLIFSFLSVYLIQLMA